MAKPRTLVVGKFQYGEDTMTQDDLHPSSRARLSLEASSSQLGARGANQAGLRRPPAL